MNCMPPRLIESARLAMLPYRNGRILNSEIRNSGSATRISTNTKMMSSVAAMQAIVVMVGSPNQSFSWPLSRKYSRQPTPEATRARPVKSMGSLSLVRALSAGGSSTMRFESHSENTPMGMLIKKIQCQL